jgi:hypothetical protein
MIMGILICGGAGAIAAETPIEVANSHADAQTPEAVKAADAAWLYAEINGDYKFLEWFLLDDTSPSMQRGLGWQMTGAPRHRSIPAIFLSTRTATGTLFTHNTRPQRASRAWHLA